MLFNSKVVDWFGDLFGEGDYLDYEEDYTEVKLLEEIKIKKRKKFHLKKKVIKKKLYCSGGDNKEILSRPWK